MDFSKKALKLKSEIEKKTGIKISLHLGTIETYMHAQSEYVQDKNEYKVYLGSKEDEENFVHELLHAKLEFLEKFSIICFPPEHKPTLNDEIYQIVKLLRSYTDDRNVAIRLYKLGYNPFNRSLFRRLENEPIKQLRANNPNALNIYFQYGDRAGELFRVLFYLNLLFIEENFPEWAGTQGLKSISTLKTLYHVRLQSVFDLVERITSVYVENDITEIEGHKKALENLIGIFDLGEKTRICRYSKKNGGYELVEN